MEIEELKELIDSTINENGERAITGKALNLCMNELVQYVASNKPQVVERLYVDLAGAALTEEQQASNAALYAKLKAAFENDELVPLVSYHGVYIMGSTDISSMDALLTPVMLGADGGKYSGKIVFYLMFQIMILLSEDGSVTFAD